jgi:hypothetical protein
MNSYSFWTPPLVSPQSATKVNFFVSLCGSQRWRDSVIWVYSGFILTTVSQKMLSQSDASQQQVCFWTALTAWVTRKNSCLVYNCTFRAVRTGQGMAWWYFLLPLSSAEDAFWRVPKFRLVIQLLWWASMSIGESPNFNSAPRLPQNLTRVKGLSIIVPYTFELRNNQPIGTSWSLSDKEPPTCQDHYLTDTES